MTLREVSAEARVSLGYISEIERGQKEASSELLASLCAALDVPLSEVLRDVSVAGRARGGRAAAGPGRRPRGRRLRRLSSGGPGWQRRAPVRRPLAAPAVAAHRDRAPACRSAGTAAAAAVDPHPARAGRRSCLAAAPLSRASAGPGAPAAAGRAPAPTARPRVDARRRSRPRRRTCCRCRPGCAGRAARRRPAVGLARAAGARPRPRPSRGRAGRGRGGRRRPPRGRGAAARRCRARTRRRPAVGRRSTTRAWWRRSAPALAGRVDPPGALHLEVGVQGPAARRAVDPGEQVLAAGDRLDDAGRRTGRRWRAGAPGSRCAVSTLAGERPVEPPGGADGRRRPQARQPQPPRGRDEAGRAERLAQRRRRRSRAAARRRPSRRSAGRAAAADGRRERVGGRARAGRGRRTR